MATLNENDYRVLQALAAAEGPVEVNELAERMGLDQSLVMAAAATLADERYASLSERTYEEFRLEPQGEEYAREGLPERIMARALVENGGQASVRELPGLTGLDQKTVGQSLRFLTGKGWAEKQGPDLVITESGRQALAVPSADEKLLEALALRGTCTASELGGPGGIDLQAAQAQLKGRKGLVRIKQRTRRTLSVTDEGREAFSSTSLRQQVNQLTSAMLADGSWRDVDFRPYDMNADTEPVYPGKAHPFRRVLEQTRRVFLELGFSEIASPFVESAFWDFDALFQPQDHPARDMQDTFYVERPSRCQLPAAEVVEAVRRTHEDGGDTGSIGWGYRWNEALASRPVLRTHTTATTVRALAGDPEPPRKVFCVGKVFRRETVDYKHLPVFYQVDGIIIDERASFASLLGTLEAFYRKMGFPRFQFRPAFFPYTEPSVEVFVYLEEKQDWVEMGGAGVFRPEVTEPFGCRVPVLAWGLGLERLAMFRYQLSDIRELYVADLQWLKEAELCR